MKSYWMVRPLIGVVLLALCGCGQQASAPQSGSSSAANSGAQQTAETAPPPPAPAPQPVVVPAGAAIAITVDQAISSKTSNPGDHFDASLAEPVLVGNEAVIPRGARVRGTVTDSKSAGKLKGNAEIRLTLDSIQVGGQPYRVRTSSYAEVGKGRGKRTAIGAGGGAALGAVVGALAGHGKGAAIGAVAGGGAGTAGAAFTGDTEVEIPAERRITFRLTDPLEIR